MSIDEGTYTISYTNGVKQGFIVCIQVNGNNRLHICTDYGNYKPTNFTLEKCGDGWHFFVDGEAVGTESAMDEEHVSATGNKEAWEIVFDNQNVARIYGADPMSSSDDEDPGVEPSPNDNTLTWVAEDDDLEESLTVIKVYRDTSVYCFKFHPVESDSDADDDSDAGDDSVADNDSVAYANSNDSVSYASSVADEDSVEDDRSQSEDDSDPAEDSY